MITTLISNSPNALLAISTVRDALGLLKINAKIVNILCTLRIINASISHALMVSTSTPIKAA